MDILIICLILIGISSFVGGAYFLLKKKPPKDIPICTHSSNPIIKIQSPNINDRSSSANVKSEDDYLIIGEVFNSLENSTDDFGEIELMSRISSLFKKKLMDPETVSLAEERINMYISDEIWDINGGRATVRTRERDARLSSMSYPEFIGTLTKIIENAERTSNRPYASDTLPTDIEIIDEDFPYIETDAEITGLPVENFEITEHMSQHTKKTLPVSEIIKSNISGGGHLSEAWRFLEEFNPN